MNLKKKLTWKVEWDDRARKELRRLDPPRQKAILNYLKKRIENSKDPKAFGKSLTSNKAGLWRYRVGIYRLIGTFDHDVFIVLVVGVEDRKEIYDS
ncbi:MAG: type II toxin-antitoxin system RelE family toxin [Janthinobacterium lividum]